MWTFSKRVANTHCGIAVELFRARTALAFDFRQDFIGGGAGGDEVGECGVEPLQELGDGFIVAADERDARFLALGGERRATDRRDFPDGDLTACVIQEGLDMIEAGSPREELSHVDFQAANACVTWSGWLSLSARFQGSSSSMRLIG